MVKAIQAQVNLHNSLKVPVRVLGSRAGSERLINQNCKGNYVLTPEKVNDYLLIQRTPSPLHFFTPLNHLL